MPTLVAIAGKSRVGKGTCASIFTELAQGQGFTAFERQLSDNGKWHLARIFHPEISRVDAVAWFEELKHHYAVNARLHWKLDENTYDEVVVPLQKFIQHGLQEGGRDIFGEHLWTDMILPYEVIGVKRGVDGQQVTGPFWEQGFFDREAGYDTANELSSTWDLPDLALISDLRQSNEAERVRECGGIVIEIHRPDVEDGYVTGKDHITERGLPSSLVDYYLNSTGDLDYFRGIATDLFKASVLPRLRGEIT